MRTEERAQLQERRRLLVGSALLAATSVECIESTFAKRFARFFHEATFWPTLEAACLAVSANQPWHQTRQLLLSFSWPQEINARDETGETMLTLAATFGRAHVVKLLCQIKADPRVENAKGWSSVHVAAAYSHLSVLQVFVALGVNIDAPESRLRYSPLHLAAAMDNLSVLQFLHASQCVNFLKKAANGYNALHVAAEHGSERCVQFLTEHYPELQHQSDRFLTETPAHKAAKSLQPQIYAHLAARGAPIDMENLEEDSAEALAVWNERYMY